MYIIHLLMILTGPQRDLTDSDAQADAGSLVPEAEERSNPESVS